MSVQDDTSLKLSMESRSSSSLGASPPIVDIDVEDVSEKMPHEDRDVKASEMLNLLRKGRTSADGFETMSKGSKASKASKWDRNESQQDVNSANMRQSEVQTLLHEKISGLRKMATNLKLGGFSQMTNGVAKSKAVVMLYQGAGKKLVQTV